MHAGPIRFLAKLAFLGAGVYAVHDTLNNDGKNTKAALVQVQQRIERSRKIWKQRAIEMAMKELAIEEMQQTLATCVQHMQVQQEEQVKLQERITRLEEKQHQKR